MRPGAPHEVLRVAVVGQVPPPTLGQYVATHELLHRLGMSPRLDVVHLPLRFARSASDLRVPRIGKLVELTLAVVRAFRLRAGGPVECSIYPVGGPARVVAARDVLLLPWILLVSRATLLVFHGGGHAEAWTSRSWWQRLACHVYRRASGAIVFTDFGRQDPEFMGLSPVFVIPHQIPDSFDAELVQPASPRTRLLYMGSLSAEKGVPQLLEAFADVAASSPDVELELVGECQPSYPADRLSADLERLGIADSVVLSGVLTGVDKAGALGRADLFVFPSVYRLESFGLVLVEAMMWRLPIVAVDWRGAADVLGGDRGGVLTHSGPDLAHSLANALSEALARRDEWNTWGERNRARYEQLYRPSGISGTESAIESVVTSRDRPPRSAGL
jgi:glycosyltransferase involved in cell wall biosynthesis